MKNILLIFILTGMTSSLYSQNKIGIHFSSFGLIADVESENNLTNGIGASFTREINPHIDASIKINYGLATGFDYRPWIHNSAGGGLVEAVYAPYEDAGYWFPNYSIKVATLQLNADLMPFSTSYNGWLKAINPIINLGAGVMYHKTNINLLNEEKLPYTFSKEDLFFTASEIRNTYDDTYETVYPDGNGVSPFFNVGLGSEIYISPIWSIKLRADFILDKSDTHDGITYQTALDPTNANDIIYIYSLEIIRQLKN